jgi:hypothetical protein
VLDFDRLPLFIAGFLHLLRPSAAMNQPVSVFPDPPEDIIESLEVKYREDPVYEEYDGQVGNDEVIPKYDIQVQVMGHKSSFWGLDNSWKYFHE